MNDFLLDCCFNAVFQSPTVWGLRDMPNRLHAILNSADFLQNFHPLLRAILQLGVNFRSYSEICLIDSTACRISRGFYPQHRAMQFTAELGSKFSGRLCAVPRSEESIHIREYQCANETKYFKMISSVPRRIDRWKNWLSKILFCCPFKEML
jgi:hypothetical protein